jgi:membrane protease YdiL (CAAX protease family)
LNTALAFETLVSNLLALAAASPLVVMGMRNHSRPDRLRLLGLSALVFVSTNLATCVPSIFGIKQPEGLSWNWVGKFACLIVAALLVGILPAGTLQKSGILRLPSRSSALPVLVVAVFCALLGWSGGVPPGAQVGLESLTFQLLMPSLAEEPTYRAILPALLSTALGSPWKLGKAQVGWGWLVCSLLFGAGHGIVWSYRDGLEFHAILFFATGLVGLLFGWLAARCLSVWPCVICHSLINSTGLAVAMLAK